MRCRMHDLALRCRAVHNVRGWLTCDAARHRTARHHTATHHVQCERTFRPSQFKHWTKCVVVINCGRRRRIYCFDKFSYLWAYLEHARSRLPLSVFRGFCPINVEVYHEDLSMIWANYTRYTLSVFTATCAHSLSILPRTFVLVLHLGRAIRYSRSTGTKF